MMFLELNFKLKASEKLFLAIENTDSGGGLGQKHRDLVNLLNRNTHTANREINRIYKHQISINCKRLTKIRESKFRR